MGEFFEALGEILGFGEERGWWTVPAWITGAVLLLSGLGDFGGEPGSNSGSAQPSTSVSQPATPATTAQSQPTGLLDPRCAGAISAAQRQAVRTKTQDWTFWLSDEDRSRCLSPASQPQDAPATPTAPGMQPGFVSTGEPAALAMPEEQRHQYCLQMIDFSKGRFGTSWLLHVHPRRKSDCHAEIVDAIQTDRDACRWTTGCDLARLPSIEDSYN
jgi:hypothetical protein